MSMHKGRARARNAQISARRAEGPLPLTLELLSRSSPSEACSQSIIKATAKVAWE